jgi:hypothetical protein
MDDKQSAVYNPAPFGLRWKFNGVFHDLPASDITAVPARAVSVIVTQLGDLGVCEIPLGVPRAAVDRVLHEAQLKHWQNQHKKHEEIILSAAETEAKRKAAGLRPAESDEVKQARKWLEEHANPPKENA